LIGFFGAAAYTGLKFMTGTSSVAWNAFEGTYTVKLPIPSSVTNKASLKVYRQEANGSLTDMNAIVEGNFLVFTTDHFSIYAIVQTDGGSTPTKQYFKLWGKQTTWEKTFLNWILLIVCFGWIWMAF